MASPLPQSLAQQPHVNTWLFIIQSPKAYVGVTWTSHVDRVFQRCLQPWHLPSVLLIAYFCIDPRRKSPGMIVQFVSKYLENSFVQLPLALYPKILLTRLKTLSVQRSQRLMLWEKNEGGFSPFTLYCSPFLQGPPPLFSYKTLNSRSCLFLSNFVSLPVF